MKKIVMTFGIFVSFFLSGCAYTVPTTVSPAVNIYSSYEDKIPGTVVLVMDDSLRNIKQEIQPSSYICSAHKFPVIMGTALTASIKQTSDALFENVVEQNDLPTKSQLTQMNAGGTVFVRLNRFSSKISFSQGFWSSSANSSCDVVLDVTVKDFNNKNLMVTSLGGSRSADGDGGAYCGNGANVLSDAISKTIKDTMERYAERISNSEKIRAAFQDNKVMEQSKEVESQDIKTKGQDKRSNNDDELKGQQLKNLKAKDNNQAPSVEDSSLPQWMKEKGYSIHK